ncbi:MAG: flippase-like domain-containing protein [Bdellovibrionaceae bacterium]|nr:flippase-like domain-containing protein [Pseudobdellovibrionaceae bacterium]
MASFLKERFTVRLSVWVRYLFGGILIFLLLHKFDLSQSISIFHISFKAYIIWFAFKLVIYFILAMRWQLILHELNYKISLGQIFFLNSLGLAAGYIFPGAAATDFGKGYFAYKHVPSIKILALSLFVDRVSGLLSILIILSVGIYLNQEAYVHLKQIINVKYLQFLIIIFITITVGIILLPKTKHYFRARISLFEHISKMRSKRLWGSSLLLSLISHLIFLTLIVNIGYFVNLEQVNWTSVSVAFPLSSLTMLIPTTPGAVGVGQVVYKYLLDFLTSTSSSDGIVIFTLLQITDLPFVVLGLGYFIYNKE